MKYYTFKIKARSLLGGEFATFAHYGYAVDEGAAKAEALKSFRDRDAEIISTLEQGFDVGDRVVVSDHPIIEDTPGVVIGYEEDGWIVVEWKDFEYIEEFHWTELEKFNG